MDLKVVPSRIRGSIAVIGSKSHTIRGITAALLRQQGLQVVGESGIAALLAEDVR